MNHIDADYFDGKSAKRIAVTITVVGNTVVVAHDNGSSEYALTAAHVQPQLKGTPRRIAFPDGSVAVTDDHAAVEAAFGVGATATLARRLESHLGFVFSALIGVAIALVLGYLYGVPWVAREIAQRLPDGIESQLAEASVKSLDQAIFSPSKLDTNLRAETSNAFAELRAATDIPSTVRLEFRDGGWIGANALALPGGVVVVTDQLINALPSVHETAAVLAHELGHVQSRHSLRHLLQSSMTALAAVAIYGDVASLTGIAVTAPTVLAHNGYSRDFEREADAFAFELLRKTGRSPKSFANAMRALEASRQTNRKEGKLHKKLGLPAPKNEDDGTPGSGKSDDFSYLSTHPATAERIRAAEAADANR